MLGIYGKHPSFGDFISQATSPHFQEKVVPWVGQMMSQTRDNLGVGWEYIYDNALPLRFWIGAHVFGNANICGVLLNSRDKVGRRFPLIAFQEASQIPAPVFDTGQSYYSTLEEHLKVALGQTISSVSEIGQGVELEANPNEPEVSTLWAVNPEPKVENLLGAVIGADHQRAADHRSYWWVAGQKERASSLLAVQGLPQAAEMAWMLTGIDRQALQSPKTTKATKDNILGAKVEQGYGRE